MFAVSTRSAGPGSPSGDDGPPSARGATTRDQHERHQRGDQRGARWRSSTAISDDGRPRPRRRTACRRRAAPAGTRARARAGAARPSRRTGGGEQPRRQAARIRQSVPTGLDTTAAVDGANLRGVTATDVPARPALDAPGLDRDTRLLSGLLEETIAAQGGEGLRSAVVRAARARPPRVRAEEPGAEAETAALAGEVLAGDPLDVIRACSMELHLANLAETRERVRRRRTYERADGPPQRESIAEAAARLATRSSKAAARALDDLRLDLTFTAHPTEATRWSMMQHAGDISELLGELDDDRLGARRAGARWSTASASRSRSGGRPPRCARDAPAGRRRGAPQPALLRPRAVRRRARAGARDRALLRPAAARVRAAALLELGGRRHGRPPRRDRRDVHRDDRPAPARRRPAAARPRRAAGVALLADRVRDGRRAARRWRRACAATAR